MAGPQVSDLRNLIDESFKHHKKRNVEFLDICGKFKWKCWIYQSGTQTYLSGYKNFKVFTIHSINMY